MHRPALADHLPAQGACRPGDDRTNSTFFGTAGLPLLAAVGWVANRVGDGAPPGAAPGVTHSTPVDAAGRTPVDHWADAAGSGARGRDRDGSSGEK